VFRPTDGSPALVGVVGPLQLDVLRVRLNDEYGLEVNWDTAEFQLARWIAADDRKIFEKFVAAHPVSFPISILGYAGLAWARRLSNDPNVALPFTAVFDRSHRLAQHKFGATNAGELADWVRAS